MMYLRPFPGFYFPEFTLNAIDYLEDDATILMMLLDKLGGEIELTMDDYNKIRNAELKSTYENGKYKLVLTK